MKFLVDAQLPVRLIGRLVAAGHEAVHTSGLPRGNRTTDDQVAAMADTDDAVVITKDSDFAISHHLSGSPRKLLLITTGNLPNEQLFRLIDDNLPTVARAMETAKFVELSLHRLTVHD